PFLLVLLSRLRSLPASTLFPYTTLFRSRADRTESLAALVMTRRNAPCVPPVLPRDFCPSLSKTRSNCEKKSRDHCACARGKRNEDRKSTRLNSSHVKISYAVFCLKKKKN